MLITDKNILNDYHLSKCIWAGIPSIEVTKKGRTFLTFYSGGTKEEIGNFVILIMSDNGKSFSSPIAICAENGYRCYDPCLWIDPLNRLWLIWSRSPDNAVFGAICENPDGNEIEFGEEFFIGNNVMLNKPIVLSTGEWLFPIAVWKNNLGPAASQSDIDEPKGAFAYITCDHGKTFKKLGGAIVKNRSFDEHMFIELSDGRLRCFVRTNNGIGMSDSYDGGVTWSEGVDSGYGGPCSRFHIRRLASGRILLINHYDYTGRNNLTAMLSEDEGETFPYRLLLDERKNVSYPDAAIDGNGMINITYDRERGAFCQSVEEVLSNAREILTARISEEDIINGSVTNPNSYLKNVALKLSDFEIQAANPFYEEKFFETDAYANHLNSTIDKAEDVISKVFDVYKINCSNIHDIHAQELDSLIAQYNNAKELSVLSEIIALIRNVDIKHLYDEKKTVDNICAFIVENLEDVTVDSIVNEFHFSKSYLRHIFRKETGITITSFKRAQQLKKAKILLRATPCKITEIAASCGFDNPTYFSEIFSKEVGISPREYRKFSTEKK
ncbi:MAG: exo-alpha-sialidase [Oscillospiraceae bacterium]|nr:exo-alpha-sialidase [Oscillospiraceae bacterium]